jgi:hypothetical protein
MKKTMVFSISICILSVLSLGCKKNSPAAPAPASVVGFWSGILTTSSIYPTTYGFDMLINSNGTIKVYVSSGTATDTLNISNTATGTYTFMDSTFKATTEAANGSTTQFNAAYYIKDPMNNSLGAYLSGSYTSNSGSGSFGIHIAP